MDWVSVLHPEGSTPTVLMFICQCAFPCNHAPPSARKLEAFEFTFFSKHIYTLICFTHAIYNSRSYCCLFLLILPHIPWVSSAPNSFFFSTLTLVSHFIPMRPSILNYHCLAFYPSDDLSRQLPGEPACHPQPCRVPSARGSPKHMVAPLPVRRRSTLSAIQIRMC